MGVGLGVDVVVVVVEVVEVVEVAVVVVELSDLEEAEGSDETAADGCVAAAEESVGVSSTPEAGRSAAVCGLAV